MNARVNPLRSRREKYVRDSLEPLRQGQRGTPLQNLRTAFQADWNQIRTALLDEIEAEHIQRYRDFLTVQGTNDEHDRLQLMQSTGAVRYDLEKEIVIEDEITNALLARHTA